MKKIFLTITLLGLFTLSGSIDANAKMQDPPKGVDGMFPETYVICGHYCFCTDWQDVFFYIEYYCNN